MGGNVSNATSVGMIWYQGVTGSNDNFDDQLNGPTNGIFDVASPGMRILDITDGTSNTLMVGERPPSNDLQWGWWGYSDFDNLLSTNQQYAFDANCLFPGLFSPGDINNPNACNGDSNHFFSMHPGGANWLLGDGSVKFLAYSAQPITIPLGTRAGGEAVSAMDY